MTRRNLQELKIGDIVYLKKEKKSKYDKNGIITENNTDNTQVRIKTSNKSYIPNRVDVLKPNQPFMNSDKNGKNNESEKILTSQTI